MRAADGGHAAEVAELRTELLQLDAELSEATIQLQLQRGAFADQVSGHDLDRAHRAQEVKLALQGLEAERQHMDDLHRQLEAEGQATAELEAECESLERRLDLRSSPSPKTAAPTESQQQELQEILAAVAVEEELATLAQERLAFASAERSSLLASLQKAEADCARVEEPQRGGQAGDAARVLLRAALGDLAEEAAKHAQVAASRMERRIEDASCRIAATAASTKVVSAALARRGMRQAPRRSPWDEEMAGLLDALREAEAIASRQLELHRLTKKGELDPGSAAAATAAAEVAALRHAVGVELKAGFAQGLEYVSSQQKASDRARSSTFDQ
eukprot:gb/GFBE01058776.1/.p1 GENE.gb/GFBE01058776.1/~~gb/GFBE01058776.1/.p1  ORF type:complete len:331 (+),score=86.55 gb/GFBE01058776.1/:1-993(+)